MVNTNGTITLNGITDNDLAKIWEFKAKHENEFTFQPNIMQQAQMPGGGEPFYNNVHFSWSNEAGLLLVHEVLGYLLKKEEKQAAAQ